MPPDRHILSVCSDDALIAALGAAARQLGHARVQPAPTTVLHRLQAYAQEAAAVVAEIDLADPEALEELYRLARVLREAKIIVAAGSATPEDVRNLFRAGAADVLTAPFDPDRLATSLAEIISAAEVAAGGGGRLISVIKSGGGAGATTLAVNFAALLARGDAKLSRPRRTTAVLDLDLQFGGCDLALDLSPKSGIVDVLRAPERVDARFLQGVLSDHASGLRLLAGAPGVLPLDAMTTEVAKTLVDQVVAGFERTVVDLPSGWTDWSLQIAGRSDMIVLVSTPTVAGAVGARRALDALAEARIERPVFFVLTRLAGLFDAVDRPPRIGRTLDLHVDAALPFEPGAAKAADRGLLLADALASTRFGKALRSAVNRLDHRLELDAVERASPPRMEAAA